VEMATVMALIYKELFPSISTFETLPPGYRRVPHDTTFSIIVDVSVRSAPPRPRRSRGFVLGGPAPGGLCPGHTQAPIWVLDARGGTGTRGALFSVDPSSAFRILISDFGASTQGPLGVSPISVAAAPYQGSPHETGKTALVRISRWRKIKYQ
jgi:hypothetical protein